MISHLLPALLGLMCLAAGVCVHLHQQSMSPSAPNYPTKRARLRFLMFVWGTLLIVRGWEILQGAFGPHPLAVTWPMFGTTLLLVCVQAAWLEDQLRSWLPARWQARFARLMFLASCGQAAKWKEARISSNAALRKGVRGGRVQPVEQSLAELSMQGATVVGPCEGPEVLSGKQVH